MNRELLAHRKSRILLRAAALAFGALVVVSCATTPKPPAATAATQPAAQAGAPTAELQKAKALKQQIDQYQLGSLVPTAYREGSDALTAGEQAMGTDNATAKSKLDTAIADFNQVLSTGFPLALKQEQQAVAKAKSDADSVKADRAVPAVYQQAQSYQQQAQAKENAGSMAEAYGLLKQAASTYDNAAAEARRQRAQAETALQAADTAVGHAKSQVETIQKNLESSLSQDSSGGSSGSAAQSATGGQ